MSKKINPEKKKEHQSSIPKAWVKLIGLEYQQQILQFAKLL